MSVETTCWKIFDTKALSSTGSILSNTDDSLVSRLRKTRDTKEDRYTIAILLLHGIYCNLYGGVAWDSPFCKNYHSFTILKWHNQLIAVSARTDGAETGVLFKAA